MNTPSRHFRSPWKGVWNILPLLSVLTYGSHSVLLNLCKDETGVIPFNSAAVVIMLELTKLLFALAFWLPEIIPHYLTSSVGSAKGSQLSHRYDDSNTSTLVLPLRSGWVFAIPAALYAINNNLVVYIQHYMDPASFQILSNLKIASTAILYRVVLLNRLSSQQWVAIGLLLAGSICNSIGGIRASNDLPTSSEVFITLPGLLLLLVYCSISGIAGIYTEYVLKKQKQVSLNQQNVLMYIYGLSFNLVWYLVNSSPNPGAMLGFFHRFSPWTVLIILTQSANGLLMASILKHGNNIIRLFIISAAMLVTTVLSVLIFSLQLTPYFYVSLGSMMLAVCLYYKR